MRNEPFDPCHGCSSPGDPEYGDWSDSGGPTPEEQRARESGGSSGNAGSRHRADRHSTGGAKTASLPAAVADFSSITRSILDWLRASSTGSGANLLAVAPIGCGARMVGMCGGGGSLGRIPSGKGNGQGFFSVLKDYVGRLLGKTPKRTPTLVNNVPAYEKGAKTQGTLVRPDGSEAPLISGWHPPAAAMPKGTPGMNIVTKSHVEAHAAAIIRNEGLASATLWINRAPCAGGPGCAPMLPRMVPRGSTLNISVVPNGTAGSVTETLIIRGVG